MVINMFLMVALAAFCFALTLGNTLETHGGRDLMQASLFVLALWITVTAIAYAISRMYPEFLLSGG